MEPLSVLPLRRPVADQIAPPFDVHFAAADTPFVEHLAVAAETPAPRSEGDRRPAESAPDVQREAQPPAGGAQAKPEDTARASTTASETAARPDDAAAPDDSSQAESESSAQSETAPPNPSPPAAGGQHPQAEPRVTQPAASDEGAAAEESADASDAAVEDLDPPADTAALEVPLTIAGSVPAPLLEPTNQAEQDAAVEFPTKAVQSRTVVGAKFNQGQAAAKAAVPADAPPELQTTDAAIIASGAAPAPEATETDPVLTAASLHVGDEALPAVTEAVAGAAPLTQSAAELSPTGGDGSSKPTTIQPASELPATQELDSQPRTVRTNPANELSADGRRAQGHGADEDNRPRKSDRSAKSRVEPTSRGATEATPNSAPAGPPATTQAVQAPIVVAAEPTALGSAGAAPVDARPVAAPVTAAGPNPAVNVVPQPTDRAASTYPAAFRAAAELTDGQSAVRSIDRTRFVQRVGKAMQVAAERGGPLRLRLSPPELGALRLEITLRGGQMQARVEATTETARQALLENLPLLRERLAEQNIRLEQFEVDLQAQSDGQQRRQPETGDPSRTPRRAPPQGSLTSAPTPDEPPHERPVRGVAAGQLNVVV